MVKLLNNNNATSKRDPRLIQLIVDDSAEDN
jgi:hypothetical protein